jgi:hypothetical protein
MRDVLWMSCAQKLCGKQWGGTHLPQQLPNSAKSTKGLKQRPASLPRSAETRNLGPENPHARLAVISSGRTAASKASLNKNHTS